MVTHFDVVIVGGGPGGSACALSLATSGLRVALLDKCNFPRDKTCGDALSLDVLNQLEKLSPATLRLLEEKGPMHSYGVKLTAPNGRHVTLPFLHKGEKKSGIVFPRYDFDRLLMDAVRRESDTVIREGCVVNNIQSDANHIHLSTNQQSISCKLIVGADGAQSVVKRNLLHQSLPPSQVSAGLRMYYENVHGFEDGDPIELYFLDKILPGYLWIFPLPDGKANVGLGVLSAHVRKRKIDLKKFLSETLHQDARFSERFKAAKPAETVKGHTLPLGSKKRIISGNRFLLVGDAASLIDPFSGEGIGNAIRSGRLAAEQVKRAFAQDDFSAACNRDYDRAVYQAMWPELKISRQMQRIARYPFILNFLAGRAAQFDTWSAFLSSCLEDVHQKKKLLSPRFHYLMWRDMVTALGSKREKTFQKR